MPDHIHTPTLSKTSDQPCYTCYTRVAGLQFMHCVVSAVHNNNFHMQLHMFSRHCSTCRLLCILRGVVGVCGSQLVREAITRKRGTWCVACSLWLIVAGCLPWLAASQQRDAWLPWHTHLAPTPTRQARCWTIISDNLQVRKFLQSARHQMSGKKVLN